MQSSAFPGRSLLRSLNSGAVLRTVIEQGPVSRAEIARATNLSNVTVGAIVTELLGSDLLTETGETSSTAGRPGRLLELNSSAYGSIGVKLSDRAITCALTDLRAEVVAEASLPLEHPSVEDFVAALVQLVEQLITETGLPSERLLGVGIGLPGVVDRATGTAVYSPFLRWVDVPVVALAEAALNIPVLVENDVNTLALTERWFGLGQGAQDFLVVTLGQGIGLGIVLGGKLHSGVRGGVGELGHTVATASTEPCECGNVGCLEALASEGALLRFSAELTDMSGGDPVLGMNELYARAETDAAHAEILKLAGEAVGRSIANLINVLSPEFVLVRGSGHFEGSLLATTIADSVENHTFAGLAGRTALAVEHLDDVPWARGAASLVLSELFMSPADMTAGVDTRDSASQ